MNQSTNEISVGNWVITILLTAIPVVNIIMLFVWAFGSGTPQTKANWAKAMLIWVAISVILGAIWLMIFGTMAAAM